MYPLDIDWYLREVGSDLELYGYIVEDFPSTS
jgi:hypothetical protein